MRIHSKAGISAMALLSCVAFAQAGFAEDAAPAPATARPPASSQQAAPAAKPQGGQATAAQQQANVTKFDDWYYRCVDGKAADGAAKSSCEVAQIASVKQGDQTVNVLTLAFAKAKDAGQRGTKPTAPGLLLTTLVPLNVNLPAGLSPARMKAHPSSKFRMLPSIRGTHRSPTTISARNRPAIPARPYRLGRRVVCIACLLILCFLLSLLFGKGIHGWTLAAPGDFLDAWTWRGPRAIGAASAGAMLALAGTILQRLTGNDMASPEVLGLGGGASLALTALLLAIPCQYRSNTPH